MSGGSSPVVWSWMVGYAGVWNGEGQGAAYRVLAEVGQTSTAYFETKDEARAEAERRLAEVVAVDPALPWHVVYFRPRSNEDLSNDAEAGSCYYVSHDPS